MDLENPNFILSLFVPNPLTFLLLQAGFHLQCLSLVEGSPVPHYCCPWPFLYDNATIMYLLPQPFDPTPVSQCQVLTLAGQSRLFMIWCQFSTSASSPSLLFHPSLSHPTQIYTLGLLKWLSFPTYSTLSHLPTMLLCPLPGLTFWSP